MRDAEPGDGRAATEGTEGAETTARDLIEHIERLRGEAEGLARRIERELAADRLSPPHPPARKAARPVGANLGT